MSVLLSPADDFDGGDLMFHDDEDHDDDAAAAANDDGSGGSLGNGGGGGSVHDGKLHGGRRLALGDGLLFSAGPENIHSVRPVRRGDRWVLLVWFHSQPWGKAATTHLHSLYHKLTEGYTKDEHNDAVFSTAAEERASAMSYLTAIRDELFQRAAFQRSGSRFAVADRSLLSSPASGSTAAGTVAIVTGASRGIGLEMARQLAGATGQGETFGRVFALARREVSAGLHKAVAASASPGGGGGGGGAGVIIPLAGIDVTDETATEGLAHRLINAKVRAVDLLVLNAGRRGPVETGIGNVDMEAAAATHQVNALGPLRIVRALLPFLKQAKAGARVVLISSDAASSANAEGNLYGYRMSKAAANTAVLNLAEELRASSGHGRRIKFLVLHPGQVATAMTKGLIDPAALLDPAESVRGLRARIAELRRSSNAGNAGNAAGGDDPAAGGGGGRARPPAAAAVRFRTYDGKSLPWR
eukprot:g6675.t1